MSSSLPRFISEKEIAERKLRDAAEGKKEEPYDPRPLYDRLQAERARQQEEYEASTAFKNQIHRLDADEAAFLAKIDREKCLLQESVDQEAEQLIQEAKISFSFALDSHSTFRSQHLSVDAKKPHLEGASSDLVSPSSDSINDPTVPKDEVASASETQCACPSDIPASNCADDPSHLTEPQPTRPNNSPPNPSNEVSPNAVQATSTQACVLAGLLPGLEAYGDSDESSDNSDKESSSGVEDAAVILSSIAILRGKRAHEPDIGE
ncbi:unnamed protein product [Taenia asiatica]|uniref:Nefa_Nip30_N domain-containing protein n=1 Tax=Taenia asiatica TaxID=60517 RepID=A0A0R3WBM1_TAEAS|nr:unnamed protein product [Taenia asiatica]